MQFLTITLKRAGFGLVLLLAVLVLCFLLMHLAPGDIADTIAQDAGGLDPEAMAQIRKDYGLDLPLWQQMLKYFSNVALRDLGYSFYYNQPVTTLIVEKLPATLLLVISAQVVSIFLGVLLGSLLGAAFSYSLVVNGLDFSDSMGEGMSTSGVVMATHFYGAWDIPRMITFAIACFIVTFIAAIWPAWKVSRLEPVKALRNQV